MDKDKALCGFVFVVYKKRKEKLMRKHIIPQEFNQHDKIGKFSVPQVAVLAVGTFIFVMIVMVSDFIVSLIAFFPIAVFTFIFMFFKINRVPLYEFLLVYLVYAGTPKLLIYRSNNVKTEEDVEDELIFVEHVKTDKRTKNGPSKNKNSNKKKKQHTKKQPNKSKKIQKNNSKGGKKR